MKDNSSGGVRGLSRMFKDNFNIYFRTSVHYFLVYILGIIIFTCFRTAFLLTFGNFQELSYYKLELLYAYWTGFRFDTTVLACGLSAVAAFNLLILFLPFRADTFYEKMKKYVFWYVVLLYSAFLVILFVDYFFYMFFQSHLNTVLFGFFDGNEFPVLTSIWTDYPAVRIIAVTGILVGVLSYTLQKIFRKSYVIGEAGVSIKILFGVVSVGLYLLAPFAKQGEAFFSANLFLNDLALNGMVSLQRALSEGNAASNPDMRQIEAMRGKIKLQEVYFTKTRSNPFLKKEPPNVIFVVMDGFSNYYLDLHSRDMNLLGGLEKQLPYCTIFRNFLPFTNNSTIRSLEGLLVSYSHPSLREKTFYLDKSLSTSVALPFLNAGYHTSFITGKTLGWDKLGKFILRQHFQTVEGGETLLAAMKKKGRSIAVAESVWGLHDEFLFDRIFSKLDDSKASPQFIFALTLSNHTPYDLPENYHPYPLNLSPQIRNKLKTSEKIARKELMAYQYANDCLGGFLERLRNSPYRDNTIVAVTGDHNMVQLFGFSSAEQLQMVSVPLIVYVPEKYRPAAPVDSTRFASHKDIFPTLYGLALSDVAYFKTGNNLFDSAVPDKDFFAVNSDVTLMDRDGYVLMAERPIFYKWRKDNPRLLEPTTVQETPALGVALKRLKAYIAERNYQVFSEISN